MAIGGTACPTIANFIGANKIIAACIQDTWRTWRFTIIAEFQCAVCGAAIAAFAVAIITFFIGNLFAIAANWLTSFACSSADEAWFYFSCGRTTITILGVTIIAFFKAIRIENFIAVSIGNLFALLAIGRRTAWIIGIGIRSCTKGTWGCHTTDTFISIVMFA